MRRLRAWMAPVALVAWTVAACDVKVQPPTSPTETTKVVSKKPVGGSPAPGPASPKPASPSPSASTPASPDASAAPGPSTAPSAAPSAAPGSSGLASPVAPAVAPQGPPSWIEGLEPLIAGPDGAVPRIAAWTALAPETGVAAYYQAKRETSATGSVTVTTSVTYAPDPPDATITLAAPPGSPGTAIAAYAVTYEYTTPNQQAAGKPPIVLGPTRVPIAPLTVPAASATAPGTPVTIAVPIGSAALRDLFQGGGNDVPGLVIATVEFEDGSGVPVPNVDLNQLRATVPIRMQFGTPPAPATAATPPPIPTFPPLVAAGDGSIPKVLGLAGISPAAGIGATVARKSTTDASGAVTVETTIDYDPAHGEATVWLTAPPKSPGTVISAYELTYEYRTPKDEQEGKPPRLVGPQLVPLPPKPVREGFLTPIRVPVLSHDLDAILSSGYPAEGPKLVKVQVEFKDDGGVPVPNADLNPMKVTIPVTVK